MSFFMSLFNGALVSIFGGVLSASFCKVLQTRRNCKLFCGYMIMLLAMQGIVCYFFDAEFLQYAYPVVVHIPLLFGLAYLTRKWMWPLVSILTAYLCCQMRRWIALLVVAVFDGGMLMQDVAEAIITFPMLFLILHFVAPVVRQLGDKSLKLQFQFGVIPIMYYIFDYLTVVYTDILVSGNPVAVEFMPFVCCVAYLVFLLYNSVNEDKQNRLQQIKNGLDIQLAQSVREINALRESQILTRQYRHDLRHHMQYVSVCIEDGQLKRAQEYISDICEEIEAHKVAYYCKNETANLIISAFVGRACKEGIDMKVQGELPVFMMVSDSDLCIILSNALENALHACRPFIADGIACTIDVQFYEQNGKMFLQITNPCKEGIRFEKDIPVSDRSGHGIGVQSICAIVDKYKGVYTFAVKDGRFILRLLI